MPAIGNPVTQRQQHLLRKRALEMALDFSRGRPPMQEEIAVELGVTSTTIRNWFHSDKVAELLDEVAPLWPNVAHSRNKATENLEATLNFIADLALGRIENARAADRLKAAQYLLALAGVSPGAMQVQRQGPEEERRSAINIELFVSGMPVAAPAGGPKMIEGEAVVVED